MTDRFGWLTSLPDTDKVAIIALCGVLISAAIAYLSSRRTIYIDAVTAERSKWIDEIRRNIASLSGEARDGFFNSSEHLQYVERINGIIAVIKLQLNPFGEIDRNISILLVRIAVAAQSINSTDIIRLDDLLMIHGQWLLKAEWDKVKFEASGFTRSCALWMRLKIRTWRYRKFSRGEGNTASW